jgi:hypothetical protein
VTTTSTGVSRAGLSVRLSPPPPIDTVLPIAVELPDGQLVEGEARCRGALPGDLVGVSLAFDGPTQARWDAFVDEEETTGSLWRMIGRIADAPDDALAPRGVTVAATGSAAARRFHTAGENGLAWRLAFHKHPAIPPRRATCAWHCQDFANRGEGSSAGSFVKTSPCASMGHSPPSPPASSSSTAVAMPMCRPIPSAL